MRTVSNTTPIISLASIDRIDILEKIFKDIVICEAVYNEIKAKRSFGYFAVDSQFIEVQAVKGGFRDESSLNSLDRGEAESIILAEEISADYILIDENLGYKIAKEHGLTAIRTLSILLSAKEKGIIKEVKPLLDEMISKGRWYSRKVYYSFLDRIGEI